MTHNTRDWETEFDEIVGKDSLFVHKGKVIKFLHQELQKARQTWLREEIVMLEGMKEDEKTMLGEEIRHMRKGRNVIIQTIQSRYQSELDQPNK